jgi:senataxin
VATQQVVQVSIESCEIQVLTIFSLSTLHREYAALVSVAYYDLFETILRPRLSKASRIERRDIEQTMAKYSVNEPQATAILSSLQTDGFVLIQGCATFYYFSISVY